MNSKSHLCTIVSVAVVLILALSCFAEEASSSANNRPLYQALRTGGFAQEAYRVNNLTIQREGALFELNGTVWFLAPVGGKVTGAVFQGKGTFKIAPPLEYERNNLRVLTKGQEFVEEFGQLALFFTDGTHEQIKEAGQPTTDPPATEVLDDARRKLRAGVYYNIYGRLLQDVMSREPGGFFCAMIKGSRYSSKELFVVDPHGIPRFYTPVGGYIDLAPEEVAFEIYKDENHEGIWAAYHLLKEYATGEATGSQRNDFYDIEHQNIDIRIEKSGILSGDVTTTIISRCRELRVIPLDLFWELRVSKVTDVNGAALSFIQEDKDFDSQFYVILPRALPAGEKMQIVTSYRGKNALYNVGSGNFYPSPLARDNWYPNKRFGEYETYDMKFRVPKGMTVVATGVPVSSTEETGESVSVWKAAMPQAVAGFNYGLFKKVDAKLEKQDYVIESYTNVEPPDIIKTLKRYASGEMTAGEHQAGDGPQFALGMLDTRQYGKVALSEAQIATKLYTDYFGPLPYQRLAMTQQYATNYGQSWPGLIYLPLTYFFDSTVRHQLGIDDPQGYFRVVAPHEVAHQWWGHALGSNSYRDQWMSEGFAEASSSIFLQLTSSNPEDFREFWREEKKLLLDRNKEGYRAIDVGPLIMGYRLSNKRTGYNVPYALIYPKGGFVLHMIRMMMWTPKQQDQNFKAMMSEFVRAHLNQPTSTEDFKTIVEKYMTPGMDMEGNHKMDWFFNQYVYGTALPTYKFESAIKDGPDGSLMLNFKLTQSNVDENFVMPVPLYLELPNGHAGRLGAITIRGNSTVEQSVNLGKPAQRYKRAILNYNYDVLADFE